MQRLAVLALDLHHLSRSLPKPVGEARAAITQFAKTTEQLITDLQQFAHQLHPSLLNPCGLGTGSTQSRGGIREENGPKDGSAGAQLPGQTP